MNLMTVTQNLATIFCAIRLVTSSVQASRPITGAALLLTVDNAIRPLIAETVFTEWPSASSSNMPRASPGDQENVPPAVSYPADPSPHRSGEAA